MPHVNQVLGTIISSVLNYDQLCEEIKETPSIDNTKSTYVPCDGRSIAGSRLEKLTAVCPKQPDPANHITNSPDLRGRFMRGLNQFYNPGEPALDISEADPDGQGRKVGQYQPDELLKHEHNVRGSVLNCGSPTGAFEVINNTPTPTRSQTSSPTGGTETRPKNVTVYYYIKIN